MVDINARHAEKMRKLKAAKDKRFAARTLEKGLLIVHTGTGKGKSTAAFGMVLRAIGHGKQVGIVQFVKGLRKTGEREVLKAFPDQVEVYAMGQGFTWETQDRERDIAAARAAWAKAEQFLDDPAIDMVLLDELNIVLRNAYLPLDDVVARLRGKRADQHVIVTGRNAKPAMIEAADLVTEMTSPKHHFQIGVKSQEGIEY